jgi:hypothetical protein
MRYRYWGWVEEEGYPFKGSEGEFDSAVEVKELLAKLHLCFAAKQDEKIASAVGKQQSKARHGKLNEEGAQSEVQVPVIICEVM